MHRIIIPGPPGTGKTHRLMGYLDEELKKTDPEKIAYIAFSNACYLSLEIELKTIKYT